MEVLPVTSEFWGGLHQEKAPDPGWGSWEGRLPSQPGLEDGVFGDGGEGLYPLPPAFLAPTALAAKPWG